MSVSDKRLTSAVQSADTWRLKGGGRACDVAVLYDLPQLEPTLPIETERVTLRLPKNDIALLEALVEAGEFMSMSEAIRAAIRDLVRSRAPKVTEAVEARKAVFASADAAKEIEEMRAQIEEFAKQLKK